jgi:ESS family glutamate:Na+ symporter
MREVTWRLSSGAGVDNAQITTIFVKPMDMLSLSILVLFLGMYVNNKVTLLARNYIPPAVTGGLIFSICTAVLWGLGDIELEFDMRFRDLLLLVFFSTVGFSARLKNLAAGGRALAVMVLVAAVFLLLQNTISVGLAKLFGVPPAYGLMAGSVSLAGGHGTAAAWGAQGEAAGFSRASEVGLVFATFGLVFGGLLGGPIAKYLIRKHGLEGPASPDAENQQIQARQESSARAADSDPLFAVLRALLLLAICVSLGDIVNRYLISNRLLMPGFLTAMFVAIIITNLLDSFGHEAYTQTAKRFGDVSLNIFLAMSMMTLQLWHLSSGAGIIFFVLAVQVVAMTLFATFIVFRIMGKDYDAAVMAAGFTGLGLGATPVAIANMEAVTHHYGPSIKAFIVIPLIGAFFIDLLNAGVINLFIGYLK